MMMLSCLFVICRSCFHNDAVKIRCTLHTVSTASASSTADVQHNGMFYITVYEMLYRSQKVTAQVEINRI